MLILWLLECKKETPLLLETKHSQIEKLEKNSKTTGPAQKQLSDAYSFLKQRLRMLKIWPKMNPPKKERGWQSGGRGLVEVARGWRSSGWWMAQRQPVVVQWLRLFPVARAVSSSVEGLVGGARRPRVVQRNRGQRGLRRQGQEGGASNGDQRGVAVAELIAGTGEDLQAAGHCGGWGLLERRQGPKGIGGSRRPVVGNACSNSGSEGLQLGRGPTIPCILWGNPPKQIFLLKIHFFFLPFTIFFDF